MSKRHAAGRRIQSVFSPGRTGRAAVASAIETLERRSLMAATVVPVGKILPAPKTAAIKSVVTAPVQTAVKVAAVKAAAIQPTVTKTPAKGTRVVATPAIVGPAPVITEFVASNANGLTDAAGGHPDWIEIQNQGDATVDLTGWHLSDNAGNRAKWTFPSGVTLAPGAYMVVLADSAATSGPDSLGYLHTNFSLSADGENLSLSKPDNTVVSEYNAGGAAYPKQSADVSYGPTSVITASTPLLIGGAPAKAIAVTSNALDGSLAWTLPGYADGTWKSGTTGVGYDGGGVASVANLVGKWDAQTLPTNSTQVNTWSSSIGGYSAVASPTNPSSTRRPTYVASAINGKPALRFDGSNDQMRVTNGPLNGATDFSVAFVFRSAGGGQGNADGWYNNSGIVDAEVGGATSDWGLALSGGGYVGAGIGDPDTTLYSQPNLNDGNAHTVVFTKVGGTTALSIDGAVPIYGSANTAARTTADVVFGSLQTNANFLNGDIGEIRLYNAGLNEDTARSLSSELATRWSIPSLAAGAYTPQIGLDLRNEMAGVASTAAVRIPFTVSNPSQYNKLVLNMKYDDGFVAYLNGTEIARRNTPGGAITFTSTASGVRSDTDALKFEAIDVSGYVGLLNGTGQNILAIRALNAAAGDSDLIVVPELAGATGASVTGFMTAPSPGQGNGLGYYGFVQTPSASVKHGFFSAPQSVTISSATPGATLVYTTNGSEPTLTNGTKVLPANGTTAPSTTINVSTTTVVRMAAFRDGYLASPVQAESYMFLSDILTQPEYTPAGAYWDVGMDTDVVNNTGQTFSVAQALTSIPTISMSLNDADMFGAANGIYTHPLAEGDLWERPASIEYFDPNNAANQFMINAGVRVQGSFSRNISRPKKGFKLFFRAEYGQSKLEFPFFGTTNPQQVFDHLILRAGHNHSWANDENYNAGDYMRDQFARDLQKALTGKSSNGNWAHLYINGQYWGLYNPTEDVDPDWAEANYGGSADDYDIIKPTDSGGVEADDGTLAGYNALFALADSYAADTTITTAEYNTLAAQLDMKGLADYMLSSLYRGDKDSPVLIGSTTAPRNFIALHDRVTPGAKWQFQTQDGEISIDDVNFDRTEVKGDLNPGRLYNQLRNGSPEFRQIFMDEFNKAFGANGVMTVIANRARYFAIQAKIDKAIVGEAARWGNFKAPYNSPVSRDVTWLNEINWITNTYMPQRDGVFKNLIRADYPELNTLAPTVSVNGVPSTGGAVANGASITLGNTNSPAGQVYYTLDGTDPRAAGGAVGSTAVAYTGAITLTGGRTLNARVLRNNVWSPVTTAVFTVAPPSLRLSELMYHPNVPSGGTFAKDEYEFIELTNTGLTSVDLGGMTLNTGAAVTVPAGTTLAAGAKGVFVKNVAAFQARYGSTIQILGTYTDYLSNGSERVTLYDANSGSNIFDVTYVDSWYPSTDNGGYSLVVNNLGPSQAVATVLGAASAWRASLYLGGSPGLDDVVLPLVKVTGMTLDDGTAQRSLVRTATLVFDGTLTPASFAPGAITLTQNTGTPSTPVSTWTATISGVTTPVAGQTSVTVTFAGAAAVGGSIADGRYTLLVDGAKITDSVGRQIDALGTGSAGSAKDYAVARLYGDLDGDLGVSINDFNALSASFGKVSGTVGYLAPFDYDGDNGISINDFNQFASRFGLII